MKPTFLFVWTLKTKPEVLHLCLKKLHQDLSNEADDELSVLFQQTITAASWRVEMVDHTSDALLPSFHLQLM